MVKFVVIPSWDGIKGEKMNRFCLHTVDTINIKDLAITTAKLANVCVTKDQIAGNAVTDTRILDGNVTESKIGSLAVSAPKLAANSVITSKIADLNVTTAKVNDEAVTEAKIAPYTNYTNKNVSGLSGASSYECCDIDLGSVNLDQQIMVFAEFIATNFTVATYCIGSINKKSGTSVIESLNDKTSCEMSIGVDTSYERRLIMVGILRVTTAGTLVLRLTASSTGNFQIASGAAQMAAYKITN